MPRVTATPHLGIYQPLHEYAKTYEGVDQPPEDAVIGECAGEAIRSAWKAGYDPALQPFFVKLTFS